MKQLGIVFGILALTGCMERDSDEEMAKKELSQMALDLSAEDKDVSEKSLEESISFR